MPDFHGEFEYGIDASRRVMVPARWRLADPSVSLTVIRWPIGVEDYLLVLPPERLKVMIAKLRTRSLHDEGVASLERVLFGTSVNVTFDKVGRLTLPEDMTKPVGITDKVRFVGRSDKFEIWNPEKRKQALIQDKIVAAKMFREIDL